MRHRWLACMVILVLSLSACGGAATTGAPGDPPVEVASTPTEEATTGGEPVGSEIERAADAAPDFSVTTFDGKRFTLSERTGMPVVINFFDSW